MIYTDFEALYKGLMKCKCGVMWKDSTALYVSNALKNTYLLRQELINKTYEIRPYQLFTIVDPKTRDITATNIRDRQVQRSLCDTYLYRELTRSFIRDSYSCLVGRGMDDAIRRMTGHLRNYYLEYGSNEGYVLKCDIKSYFGSTDHDLAKAAVAKRIGYGDEYKAVEQIIDSFDGSTGIGLGSQVSQLIQLAVLDDMDHYIKEKLKIKYYSRYMDDFILIHPDKEYLNECLRQIKKMLEEKHLMLNKKTEILSLRNGFTFLKWRFILTSSGKVVRKMSDRSIVKERRKLKKMKQLVDKKAITIEEVRQSFLCWAASAERGYGKPEPGQKSRVQRNTEKRKNGKIVRKGYTGDVVEKMRRLYIDLFGEDPYGANIRDLKRAYKWEDIKKERAKKNREQTRH